MVDAVFAQIGLVSGEAGEDAIRAFELRWRDFLRAGGSLSWEFFSDKVRYAPEVADAMVRAGQAVEAEREARRVLAASGRSGFAEAMEPLDGGAAKVSAVVSDLMEETRRILQEAAA